MGKLHVVMTKEEIRSNELEGNIAVVLDVLIATSMITVALQYGAKAVIPVRSKEEALVRKQQDKRDCIVVGEHQGRSIENFLLPYPSELKGILQNKTMILATTNGTVAISSASVAKEVYVASLFNGHAVAKTVQAEHEDETIVIICSGSGGNVSLEDFYGAGFVIHHLMQQGQWDLTDSARIAYLFYKGNKDCAEQLLLSSRVGRSLRKAGYEKEILYVAKQGLYPLVAKLYKDEIRMEESICHKL
ncbi:2-phosphosulfolactate phosphatase [Ectobacillus sp. sgz5001026]|uniref:2-phosphosulfolactate phosphatase n=1 Tax=Ectobacillus sp. sgz5001026 TaxID=3242473 RepID=UPI0036D2E55B